MGEREALLKDLEGEYENLYAVLIMGMSDAEKSCPLVDGWSVRDILAHTAGWLREGAGALERLARGEEVPPGEFDSDVDGRNAGFAEQWREGLLSEVETELHLAKEAFVTAVRSLPEEAFAEGGTARGIVFEEGIDHFKEHAQQVFEWKEREKVGRPVPPGMPREAIG